MPEKTVLPPLRGRPKDLAKRAAILNAAKTLFLENGFMDTSMDAVAGEAKVSKLTVYSHFSDKGTLFSEAVAAKCESTMPMPFFTLDERQPLAQSLRQIGLAFMEMIFDEDSIRLMRLMYSQAHQEPDMARLFYEAGPQRNLAEMANLLSQACQAGLLQVNSPQLAAEKFFSLLQGIHHTQVMIGYAEIPSQQETEQHVDQIVAFFMAAHRV